MQRTIPYRRPGNPRGPSLLFPIVGLIVLVIAAFQAITFYVDSLWFESLGYESVYWYSLRTQGLVFLAFAGATTLALWLIFRMMLRGLGAPRRPFFAVGGETISLNPAQILKPIAPVIAVVLGLVFGAVFSADWTKYALFFRQPASNELEPILGKSISFYFFSLPVLQAVTGWLLAIAVISAIAAIIATVVDMTAQFRGLSLALCLLLTALAGRAFTSRYELLLDPHPLFTGVRYVDDHVILPGLWFVIAALLAGAVIAAINIRLAQPRNLIAAAAAPLLAYGVAGVLVPAYVSTFVVRPNELVRETPYIHHTIESTRKAYGLDRVEQVPFEPRVSNAVFNPAEHEPTLDNIRLWDWRALQSTLRQVQEIRTYYDFPDVDVDRYTINGKRTQMMIAARELSLNKLPAGSRNWVNERLIYTHGYGVTMNPVSQFTNEGLPELLLSNMPVESASPEIGVTRPEIYFGQLTDWPVYVRTRQKEFNYPEGETNNYVTYEGTGGIRMGSFFRRLLLAWSVGDLTKVPFSDDITPDSALLVRRNIAERAQTLAPFLVFDSDPYMIIGDGGRLYWMIDAYTASENYPYAQGVNTGGQTINYIRNSVKAVVDAYNGDVRFYVFDDQDPLIQAYRQIFPSLFMPSSQMPAALKEHVRYPELLFQVQALMYATYHVQNEQVYYNHEDVWTVAQQSRTQTGQQASNAIEPLYVLMQFPGENNPEFVNILPYTPSNRNNLIGWIAGRSDGDAYGSLRAYEFPKTRFVDGPLQIQARIDQDPQLSSQLTLWNQQGSTVIRGNLLVIPLNDILLFAEPIYLQAERSPMPELRLVVLATQDRLAYASRFPEALTNLLRISGGAPQITSTASPQPPSANSTPGSSMRTLIERANQSLTDYQRLTSEGRLGDAGQRLDELKRTLDELNKSSAVPRE